MPLMQDWSLDLLIVQRATTVLRMPTFFRAKHVYTKIHSSSSEYFCWDSTSFHNCTEKWMEMTECFRPRFCTCKAILGRGQPHCTESVTWGLVWWLPWWTSHASGGDWRETQHCRWFLVVFSSQHCSGAGHTTLQHYTLTVKILWYNNTLLT